MEKKQWIAGILSLGLLLVLIFVGFYAQNKEDECLKSSSNETTGRVEEISHYKGKNVTIYFIVDGKRYSAREKAYDARETVKVGDKFYIQYCGEDPSLNRILFDRKIYD